MFNGNEIAILFGDYCWEHRKKFNPEGKKEDFFMVASTVSSKFLATMAEVEGFKFYDTLTGFKWIGNEAAKHVKENDTFLFGYEVEIGFAVGDVGFDKDGIRCALVFYELADKLYREGKTVAQRVEEMYKKYGYFEMRASYFFYKDAGFLENFFASLENNGEYAKFIGKYEISGVRDLIKGYDSRQPDKKSLLPVIPGNYMITYYFKNGSLLTLRNSGTEPKLKYYLESHGDTKEETSALLKAMTRAVVLDMIQPSKHNLEAKAGDEIE